MSVKQPLPIEYNMPAWMKAERIEYCENFDLESAYSRKESLLSRILHFFA